MRGLISPMLVEGQLEGSVYEDVIVENGQVMNPSFLDYGFPTFIVTVPHFTNNVVFTLPYYV